MTTPAFASEKLEPGVAPELDETLLDRQLMVNPYLRVAICGGDEVMIKHGSRSRFSQVVRDDGRTKLLGRIMRALYEPSTLRELEHREVFRADERPVAQQLLRYLVEQQIVISPDAYLPHVYLSMRYGAGKSSKLEEKTVGILGAGALASRVVHELGTFRLGGYALLDDRIDAASVRADIEGTSGAPVSLVEGAMHDSAALTELFSRVDFVVAAIDGFSPSTLHAVNRAAIASMKPWLSAYLDGSEGVVGPLYVPGETLCYTEFEIQNEAATGLRDEFLTHKEALAQANGDARSTLTLSPFVSVVSGWAATAALSFLGSGQCFLAGRSLRLDFERFSVDYQELLKLPRCPACAGLRTDYRHTFL
jgi:bacteriocin biosynthesis cyclodehydratase domain-containing protein